MMDRADYDVEAPGWWAEAETADAARYAVTFYFREEPRGKGPVVVSFRGREVATVTLDPDTNSQVWHVNQGCTVL